MMHIFMYNENVNKKTRKINKRAKKVMMPLKQLRKASHFIPLFIVAISIHEKASGVSVSLRTAGV